LIVGITGGKGGTGKTAIAVNLAVALADMGKKVRLIDCDVDCPGSHLILGAELGKKQEVLSFIPKFNPEKCMKCGLCVSRCETNSLYQIKGKPPSLVEQTCTGCKTCMLSCPHGAIEPGSKVVGWTYEGRKHGVEIFSGSLKPSEPYSEKIVDAVKARGLHHAPETVIIDTAAGTHCNVVAALEGCDKAFAITEPTLFGAHDLKTILSVLKKLDIKYELILNRSDISKKNMPKADLNIPYSEEMVECYVEGTPIVKKYPSHPISKELRKLAERL